GVVDGKKSQAIFSVTAPRFRRQKALFCRPSHRVATQRAGRSSRGGRSAFLFALSRPCETIAHVLPARKKPPCHAVSSLLSLRRSCLSASRCPSALRRRRRRLPTRLCRRCRR